MQFPSLRTTAVSLPTDQVHVWTWHCQSAFIPEKNLDLLSEEEQARAARFISGLDRARFVAAHTGVRHILSKLLDLAAPAIQLTTDVRGKPRLAGPISPSIFFNLSHSHDLAAIAVSSTFEVGLDIEFVCEINSNEVVPFLSEAEQVDIARLSPSAQRFGVFNAWTRKEAFLKAVGLGLTVPLTDFDVSVDPAEPARLLRLSGAGHEADEWQFAHIIPAPGFVGAVAARALGWKVSHHGFVLP